MTDQEHISELEKDVAAWEKSALAWKALARELDEKLKEAIARFKE